MTSEERKVLISEIENLPNLIFELVKNLSDEQLNTPYGEGKWTVRQVIHHLADSHMHAYIRMKFAFVENNPTIKPYEQVDWANLFDAKNFSIDSSISILKGLHARWTSWLKSLNENDFTKKAFHPENGEMDLDRFLKIYANHGKNHYNQILGIKTKLKW